MAFNHGLGRPEDAVLEALGSIEHEDSDEQSPTHPGQPAAHQTRTNGFLVRLVGRNRIQDGWSHTTLTVLIGILCMPYLLYTLWQARKSRESWSEVFFQFISMGGHHSNNSPGRTGATAVEVMSRGAASAAVKCPDGRTKKLRIVCISDTHMKHHRLEIPDGDILIHSGDFTNFGSYSEVDKFADWMGRQSHGLKIVVPGNHDMIMDAQYYEQFWPDWSSKKESPVAAREAFERRNIRLLVDEAIEFEGLNIYGSPWVTKYAPWRTAFNKTPAEMIDCWQGLPEGCDILITHMPPLGYGDRDVNGSRHGCEALEKRVRELQPPLHVFGHVHSDGGVFFSDSASDKTVRLNASCVCDFYRVGARVAHVVDMIVCA